MPANLLKRDACEICQIFKNTYFKEQLLTPAYVLLYNTPNGCGKIMLSVWSPLKETGFAQIFLKTWKSFSS